VTALRSRLIMSSAVAASVVGVLAASATPALALGERGDPGGHLTPIQTILIFAGIPLALFAIIAFLVCLPSIVSGPRYRPGRPWLLAGVWFSGPTGGTIMSAADAAELPESTRSGGGASARW
jgi:hypothetical protein